MSDENAKPTPGEWSIYIAPVGCDMIVNEDGVRICEFPYGASQGDEGYADAAFIVRACNAHDKLVAALRLIALVDHPDADEHNPLCQGTRTWEEVKDRIVGHARSVLAEIGESP